MFAFKTRVVLLLGGIALTSFSVCEKSGANKQREMKVPSVAGEPRLILGISAMGRQGIVSVRNEAGAQVQSLPCPLLRDHVEATPQELATVGEQFVTQFEETDLDSDGHPDLAGIREFGAKWAKYCVWLYDPSQHIFVKNFLAEQMELLTNLTSSDDGTVSSSQMGPANPWQAVYRIVGATGSRPERQLAPLFSCLLETTPTGDKPSAVVTTRYDGGEAVVQRKEAAKMSMNEALSKCSSAQSQTRK